MKYEIEDIKRTVSKAPLSYLQILVKWDSVIVYFNWFIINYVVSNANIITGMTLLLSFCSGYLFYKGYLVFGGLLFLLKTMLDSTDGNVSRLKHTSSMFGEYFDNWSGMIGNIAIYSGLTFYLDSFIPVLIYSLYQVHIFEFTKVDLLLKNKIRYRTSIEKKYIKNRISEPLPYRDLVFCYLIIAPFISIFYDVMMTATYIMLVLTIAKIPVWFLYYEHILKKSQNG